MITRRQFILSGAAISGGLASLQACTSDFGGNSSYEETVAKIWQPAASGSGNSLSLQHELVRYATLAASSHNTQCWKFLINERAISIVPDLSRRCPAVDPDDHHVFVSLGCAAENLVHAALANGLKAEAQFSATGDGILNVALEPTTALASPLFMAIPRRQCSRSVFDANPLSSDELKRLERAGTGQGVGILLLTDQTAKENILDYVVQGNTAQINDPDFVEELKTWIRFSEDEAVRSVDGLFTRSSGNPSLPRWLGSRLFSLFFTQKSENDKYAKHIRSSAGIAVFVSEANDKAHWIEAGRCYERFALQATALGIRNAMINQPVEVSKLRPQFANFLGIGQRRPDLVVRFGRGPEMPRSLRRPVQMVLA